jgi:hypothetical protein
MAGNSEKLIISCSTSILLKIWSSIDHARFVNFIYIRLSSFQLFKSTDPIFEIDNMETLEFVFVLAQSRFLGK